MKGKTIPQMIKTMSNKELLYTVNKMRKERERPDIYGKHGTTRWVTQSEFWAGHHQDFQNEIKRRQKAGLIGKKAGKSRRTRSLSLLDRFT